MTDDEFLQAVDENMTDADVKEKGDEEIESRSDQRQKRKKRPGIIEISALSEKDEKHTPDTMTVAMERAARNVHDEDVKHKREKMPASHPKLKSKDARILDELDLHKRTVNESIKLLKKEMKQWAKCGGLYCVIVGIGRHNPDGVGILREQIPRWLDCEGRSRGMAEWRWGKPREGGRGAIIVRMKHPHAGK